MLKGNTEDAIKFYKKSLAMNPDNNNAVQMLERIKNEPKKDKSGDN